MSKATLSRYFGKAKQEAQRAKVNAAQTKQGKTPFGGKGRRRGQRGR